MPTLDQRILRDKLRPHSSDTRWMVNRMTHQQWDPLVREQYRLGLERQAQAQIALPLFGAGS